MKKTALLKAQELIEKFKSLAPLVVDEMIKSLNVDYYKHIDHEALETTSDDIYVYEETNKFWIEVKKQVNKLLKNNYHGRRIIIITKNRSAKSY